MSHQPQLSINSVQSLIEPVTPPSVGQMSRQSHRKTHSLDLSNFNQFMLNSSPLPLANDHVGAISNPLPNPIASAQGSLANNGQQSTLPLISEFDLTLSSGQSQDSSIPQAANTTRMLAFGPQNMNTVSNSSSSSVASLANLGINFVPVQKNGSLSGANSNNSATYMYGAPNVMKPLNTSFGGSMSLASASSSTTEKSNEISDNANESLSILEISSTPLQDLNYLKLATDQFGCRFLQKKLENPDESNIVRDYMYDQVKPYFLNLILDPFGNYLIQKLCDYLTIEQRTVLVQSIYNNVFQISINQYGTRSLQKIIDTVDNEAQIDMIIEGFSQKHTSIKQLVILINDLNGNHVIQKCIFKFPSSKFDFIIDAIVDQNNIIAVSTHKHGCCVLQKLLSVSTLQQIFKISVKIVQFLPGLINDQFGNYIIQFLLDIKELDFYLMPELFGRLTNELCQLSCLKFSSNVVEKYIKRVFGVILETMNNMEKDCKLVNLNDDVVKAAMGILLSIVDIFTLNLNDLIRDNFGNYALQTLLDIKNYSTILEFRSKYRSTPTKSMPASIVALAQFSDEFAVKIGNLVVLTKELLPSIKTTSYAKKIKLKVKGYAEATGITFTDLTPKKGAHVLTSNKIRASGKNLNNGNISNTNNNSNKYVTGKNGNKKNSNIFGSYRNSANKQSGTKQHTRNLSLPTNASYSSSQGNAGIYQQYKAAQSSGRPQIQDSDQVFQEYYQQCTPSIMSYKVGNPELGLPTVPYGVPNQGSNDSSLTINSLISNLSSNSIPNTVLKEPMHVSSQPLGSFSYGAPFNCSSNTSSAIPANFFMADGNISSSSSSSNLYQNTSTSMHEGHSYGVPYFQNPGSHLQKKRVPSGSYNGASLVSDMANLGIQENSVLKNGELTPNVPEYTHDSFNYALR